jgi:hypothetical protein
VERPQPSNRGRTGTSPDPALVPLHERTGRLQDDDCHPFGDLMCRRLGESSRGYLTPSANTKRISMADRIQLYRQGLLHRDQVRGLRPPDALTKQWEPPEMLDAAGVIVDATFLAMPASVTTFLREHPNPRTSDGKYKPMKRYHQDTFRKHFLANICRTYWRRKGNRKWTNRSPGEPFHEYLPMELITQLVQWLLDEFQYRQNAFVDPFPRFIIPPGDYVTWKEQAVAGVQEMLLREQELRCGS